MGDTMEFRILGPTEVWRDGVEVVLDGSKPRTVLAALLLAGGHVLSDERLSTLLWGWEPPATMSAQIYTYVSRLRKYLGDEVAIVRQRPGYLLRADRASFDYAEFRRLSRAGRDHLKAARFDEAAACLARALRLWRGKALSDVTEFLADAELPGLEEDRLSVLEGRIEAELELGRHSALIPELTALVAEYPVHERFRAQLMIALYRCDRQADALGVFHDTRRVLAEELGVDPGPELYRTFQAILAGEVQTGAVAVRPTVDVWRRVRPAMLPPDITDFTGREEQVRELCRALLPEGGDQAAAPVVVTGMAGVGKTALAVRAAHECRDAFPDGQLFADLGGYPGDRKDPHTVLGWFLRALVGEAATLPESLEERIQLYRSELANRRLLLVLDGATSDAQVRPLLASGGGCRVVVTSRARLPAVAGAQVVDLEVLEPDEALDLLAKEIGARRLVAERDCAAHLVALCGHLPLAIRIVAGKLGAHPRMPLSHLAQRLGDQRHRLAELRLSDMDVGRSVEHSMQALGAASVVLRRLALLEVPDFAPWTTAALLGMSERAAERVLHELADAHLLIPAGVDQTGNLRYRFHTLVRLVAAQHAGETERGAILDRALDAWLSVVRTAERSLLVGISDPHLESALAAVEAEEHALSALFQQACTSGRYQSAWEMAECLRSYVLLRSCLSSGAVREAARPRVAAERRPAPALAQRRVETSWPDLQVAAYAPAPAVRGGQYRAGIAAVHRI
jgi:DNA-binding SARP family transcriptional activator